MPGLLPSETLLVSRHGAERLTLLGLSSESSLVVNDMAPVNQPRIEAAIANEHMRAIPPLGLRPVLSLLRWRAKEVVADGGLKEISDGTAEKAVATRVVADGRFQLPVVDADRSSGRARAIGGKHCYAGPRSQGTPAGQGRGEMLGLARIIRRAGPRSKRASYALFCFAFSFGLAYSCAYHASLTRS